MSAPDGDPWDKYRAMLDEYVEAYHEPLRFQAMRDVEVYQQLMKQQSPEDIACMLLVAINRLGDDPPH